MARSSESVSQALTFMNLTLSFPPYVSHSAMYCCVSHGFPFPSLPFPSLPFPCLARPCEAAAALCDMHALDYTYSATASGHAKQLQQRMSDVEQDVRRGMMEHTDFAEAIAEQNAKVLVPCMSCTVYVAHTCHPMLSYTIDRSNSML